MMLRFRHFRCMGFTLIEIMIVIAIIAILAGIAIPNIQQARFEANLSACDSNLKNLGLALQLFFVRTSAASLLNPNNKAYLKQEYANGEFLIPDYIEEWPYCPNSTTSKLGRYALEYSGYGNNDEDWILHDEGGQPRLCRNWIIWCNLGHKKADGQWLQPLWTEMGGVFNAIDY